MPEENTNQEQQVEPTLDAATEGHFVLDVVYKDGATQEEIDGALEFVKDFTKGLAESKEDHMPLVIEAITVKRLHK